jgi:hypothetical protein
VNVTRINVKALLAECLEASPPDLDEVEVTLSLLLPDGAGSEWEIRHKLWLTDHPSEFMVVNAAGTTATLLNRLTAYELRTELRIPPITAPGGCGATIAA